MSTNIPKITFTPNGLVLPLESQILAGAQADINTAFGGDVNPALETPQGQLASSQAAIVADKNAQVALIANQVNPDYSAGAFQDAIGRIYFINRKPALATVVSCDCNGDAGVVIPLGARAQDTSGNIYVCSKAGTIPTGGTISLDFTCVEAGPIPCPAATLTGIYETIPGWDTINNPLPGIIGRDVEGRGDFENRRRNSVALNSRGSKESIFSNVFEVDGVIDVYVIDNPKKVAVVFGATNYTIDANTVYVAVVGGDDTAIASAIYQKIDLGCNTTGNVTVIIQDRELYDYPYPSYEIKFNRPAKVTIKFAVELANEPNLPSNIVALVKAAIINAFVGEDGGKRARISATIFSSRFYTPISAISEYVSILTVLVGIGTATASSVAIGIDQYPVISEGDIAVTLV